VNNLLGKSYFRENSRKEVIKKAVGMANKGDWVLCLGKRHEKTIEIKGKLLDWNERAVLKKALQ